MVMKIMAFDHLSNEQIITVFNRFFCTDHAYALLASMHGYSLTELQTEIKDPKKSKHDFAAVEDSGDVIAAIRFERHDPVSKTVRVMIDHQVPGDDLLAAILARQLGEISQGGEKMRFYTCVFPQETQTKDMLVRLKFHQEALLDEHVFVGGNYQDLEIWGTKRNERWC